MKTRFLIIIGISIPLILFGILVLAVANNVSQMFSNSDLWMIELEPHLELSAKDLGLQIKNEDLKQLHIYRIQSLEDYFGSLTPNFERQFEAAINTDHRFVFYVDKSSGYSDGQIQGIFTDINGIKDAKYLYDWLLH